MLVFTALAMLPAPPEIVRYAMPNGEGRASGGEYNYWDDRYEARKGKNDRATFVPAVAGDLRKDGSSLSGGAGKLTDGQIGRDDWSANLGQGHAHEWVAWRTADPTIVLDYGVPTPIETLSLFANNYKLGDVQLWSKAVLSFSNDGKTFTDAITQEPSPEDRDNLHARYVDILVGRKARYVKIHLTRFESHWIFLSEIVTNQKHPARP